MMRKYCVMLLALACLAPAVVMADHHEGEDAKHDMGDHMAEMEVWMAANQPGEHHEVLQRMVGDWTYTTTSPMGEASEGTMHAESIFDGRYVLHHWKGSFMGREFEGHGVDGYDTMKGKYVSGWIDNFSTGVMTSKGECTNDDCTEMVTWSKSAGPDGKMHKSKTHVTWNGDDSFTMKMYMVPEEGDPVEQMTLTATRAGGHADAEMKDTYDEMSEAKAEADSAMAEAEAEMDEAKAEMDSAMAEAEGMKAEAEAAMAGAEAEVAEAAAEAADAAVEAVEDAASEAVEEATDEVMEAAGEAMGDE